MEIVLQSVIPLFCIILSIWAILQARKADAMALKALKLGSATSHQNKLALELIKHVYSEHKELSDDVDVIASSVIAGTDADSVPKDGESLEAHSH